MKSIRYGLLLVVMITTLACKKTSVDGSNRMNFQESINDMASSLPTLKQVKFNEALYILKTFGVEAEGEVAEISALGKLLNGKKTSDILALADQIAQKNGIEWSSTAPPSLGEMNIFGDVKAAEKDPSDIDASSINILVSTPDNESLKNSKALVVIPELLDNNSKKIQFDGTTLETIMEVSSGGNKILTSKNLLQNNSFRGFTIKFSSLPKEKIFEDRIDIKISVKTSKKILQMIKLGVPVNINAVNLPLPTVEVDSIKVTVNGPVEKQPQEIDNVQIDPVKNTPDPKLTVSKFLNNISTQNMKAAFDISENPNWGSYEKFANPNSGFGSVKNIEVKNITVPYNKENSANVNVTYDVTDKNGKVTSLNVTYGLKATNANWKITSYKINNP